MIIHRSGYCVSSLSHEIIRCVCSCRPAYPKPCSHYFVRKGPMAPPSVAPMMGITSISSRNRPKQIMPSHSARRETGGCCAGRTNQIFILTCIVSLALQIFGSIASWHTVDSPINALLAMEGDAMRRLDLREAPRTTVETGTTGDRHPDASPEVVVDLPERLRFGQPTHSRRLRVLFGILTADFKSDQTYRKRHRTLFKLWKDKRVCSLPDFRSMPLEERYDCEVIYTFVIAANPHASTELVDDSRPFEVSRPYRGVCGDVNDPDMTLLNIKENMNEGKSQTWMYYGSKIAEEYDLDYVTKCDADSLLHLHEFFQFAYKHMPPAPYNKHMYIGALRDKAYWPRHETEEERIRHESYFGNEYEGVHLYVAGQMYIMSTDLARFIGEEALRSNCSYCEGHEDHDISAMAFHSPEPIKLMVIGRSHRFWEHPVKGEPRWRRILARETARVNGVPFEGKLFTNNSAFDVLFPGH